ncbi:MAG: CAP domain-containing protein [Candidatus Shapirobacteria bacterium]|nr:CAP domain-containing protein [Candidatus Shapirobacteria bacterium]MDD4410641.1 CAP domain-containing protein [Candidatus Shapirobacteria bacterium]
MLKKLWTHYFIPQERNNHRATLLKPNFLLFFLILYLLNQSVIKTLVMVKPGILGYSSEITYQKVLDQTNNERKNAGLEPLQYSATLSESARKKAEDMFKNDYWAHNSPQGKTPWTFFDAAGYKYSVAGENLAKDFYDTDSLIKAWMNSPTHKANIIHPKYKEIGIAVVNGTLGGIKTTLVVQHFGTPLVAQAAPKTTVSKQTSDAVEPEAVTQPVSDIIPQAIDIPEIKNTEVLAGNNKKLISPLTLSKIFGSIIFIVLVIVLFVDGFITLKNNTHRLTGSNIGHIGFLIFIFLLMLYNQQGSIF